MGPPLGLNSSTRTKGARPWASHMTCVHFHICEMGIPTSQGHTEVKWANTREVLRPIHGLWKVCDKCYHYQHHLHPGRKQKGEGISTPLASKGWEGRLGQRDEEVGVFLIHRPGPQDSCDSGMRREMTLIKRSSPTVKSSTCRQRGGGRDKNGAGTMFSEEMSTGPGLGAANGRACVLLHEPSSGSLKGYYFFFLHL